MPCQSRRNTRLIAIAVIGTCAAALVGCHGPGGPGWSADRHTFISTTWEPKTITVTDTRTGGEIWAVDVPVGQQLVVGFSRGTGPNQEYPDEVVWALMPAGQRTGTRDNRAPAPGSTDRRMEMVLRPGPERVGDPLPGNPFDRGHETVTPGHQGESLRGISGN
ncbi:MAG: hypothetical protein ACTS3F_12685 [Phycisphaerales bacterium]